ncbi:MAG: DNA polymerase [Chitinophagaceae bacterium]
MKLPIIKRAIATVAKPVEAVVSKPAGRPSVLNLAGKVSAAQDAKYGYVSGGSARRDIAEDVKVIRSAEDERPITAKHDNEYVLVICDVPSHEVYSKNLGMGKKSKELFLHTANDKNLPTDLFEYVSPCPPMPEESMASASREKKWLDEHREEFIHAVAHVAHKRGNPPSAIVTLGLQATQQAMGRAVKITKIRGQIRYLEEFDVPIIPMLSPGQVFRQPGYETQFRVDFEMLKRLRDFDYSLNAAELAITNVDYKYISGRTLLQLLQEQRPKAIAFDTETYNDGGSNSWWAGSKPFIVQIAWRKGESYVVPIQAFRQFEKRTAEYLAEHKPYDYWTISDEEAADNLRCVKQVLESGKYFFTGHNLTYDWQVLANVGVKPALDMWLHDSMQLMFVMDENTISKDLASGAKLYVPELSGYSDKFEEKADYSEMPRENPDDMLFYSAADSDASLRMTSYLVGLTKQDTRHFNCYTRIQMPALRMFYDMERTGMLTNKENIRFFTQETQRAADERYAELIGMVDPEIRAKWFDARKPKSGLSFTRKDLVRDILFTHPKGLCLTPMVFTKSTKKLPDDQKVASVSSKDHLTFFEGDHEWVALYQEYNKFDTILKFAGCEGYNPEVDEDGDEEEEVKGIWKYIAPDNAIHPSYFLHRTKTGRVASANPNGQNIPKHDKPGRVQLSKAYRAIFVARPGKVFISVDLSQAELRIAAWEANEKTMLRLYNNGDDLHLTTAARTMNLAVEEFLQLPENIREVKRQGAKAVNFGYLFGMWWRKFKLYAKTTYGVDFTDEESKESYEAYFALYKGLVRWHKEKRDFVNKTGYIRSLHGRIRHLPAIRSYDKGIRQEAERQAINSTVQGFASDWGLIAAIRFHRDADPNEVKIVSTIHDALILEAIERRAEHYAGAMKWYMENNPMKQWFGIVPPLPIVADVEIGPNLKDLRKRKDIVAFKPDWFTSDN